MAGIANALRRVADHKNVGVVRAINSLTDDDGKKVKYAIIQLDHDKGMITQYDYGSDIRISKDLKVGDSCILMVRDNWSAEWLPGKEESFSITQGDETQYRNYGDIQVTMTGSSPGVKASLAPDNLDDCEKLLKKWCGRFRWDGFDWELNVAKLDDIVKLVLFTEKYKYTINAKPTYLGCTVSSRTPRAGENHTRGNDLADGKFGYDTWIKIVHDVVGYELKKPVQAVSKTLTAMVEPQMEPQVYKEGKKQRQCIWKGCEKWFSSSAPDEGAICPHCHKHQNPNKEALS